MKMTIMTTALIMLLVAAAPQDVRAQEATYFKLTGVTLSDVVLKEMLSWPLQMLKSTLDFVPLNRLSPQ